jgi:hypothetical protein
MNMSSKSFEEAIQQAVQPGPGRLLPGIALAAASIREGEQAYTFLHKPQVFKRLWRPSGCFDALILHRGTHKLPITTVMTLRR